ncbi:4-(cytidine 5'-diphospho)-2-C-methyl-D-erythritol kinase [Caproiciproducens faecalis]|uniref:4-diphosphocytidyl-2-C-methyl-D-erythritol kinase n=1 Tax=Caproiciproducens faecalis TaxID=2820301 RepID=A0ABS7DQI9_9FIRM|nr:4-(cytidine 5'-diphospho)-2-C-methyl-D-erythritol kinase [Caproiciproducens faecalis]MBW7573555.1 4-(cytidine 5'-diphospho)-2-C-methyl-D-erythritol kinase [Caproiciproducens faecalis]
MPFSVKANAKINLTLDITGKREDGYHLLRMVMQSVSLCDTLTLRTEGEGTRLFCDRDEIPCKETNTVYQAAAAFFALTGIAPNLTVHIKKVIPTQAGLGGGSADAAAVLHALNQIHGTGLTEETLCALGLKIGADVPFCVVGGTVLAEGIGEKLTVLPSMPPCHIVICKPPVGVNTQRAYALADAASKRGSGFSAAMLEAVQTQDLHAVAQNLGNEFEQVMHLAEVQHIKTAMTRHGALGACMTGSGSAVFGIFEDPAKALSCQSALKDVYPEVFVCEPVPSGCVPQNIF